MTENTLERSMTGQKVTCPVCGAEFDLDRGRREAAKHDLEADVVQCWNCHSVFDYSLEQDKFELGRDVSQKFDVEVEV